MMRTNRLPVKVTPLAFAIAAGVMMSWAQAPQAPVNTPLPTITGPINGPGAMFPGLQSVPPGTAPADLKYVTNEYFVSGTASGKPYTTRIVVRKPSEANRFSGIVVSEPMHSSGNSWMFFFTRLYVMNAGHAHVEIAPQKAAAESQIIASNAARYASLSIPEAGQANEIIAQVGTLIKSNLPNGPLPGLRVRRLFLMGTSQSAGTVRGYLDAHPIYRMASGAPIYDGFLPTSTGGNSPMPKIDVPLIQIPTLTEVNGAAGQGNGYRRPDGDDAGNQFRLYEFAGMPHNDSRENPTYSPDPCKLPISKFPVGAYMAVGLAHLIQWADGGKTPPRAERIQVDGDTANDGSLLALDAYGNVKGGIRTTYVDVPLAKYGVPNLPAEPPIANPSAIVAGRGAMGPQFYCGIAGYETRLPDAQLRSLHRNKQDYQSKVEQSLKRLTQEGWFLPVYNDQVLGDAAKATLP